RAVHGLLEHRSPADPLVDDAGGHLAGTEPRNADRAADLLVGRIEAGLQLVEGHLDGEPDTSRAQVLDGALHSAGAPCECPVIGVVGSVGGGCKTTPLYARNACARSVES